MRLPSLRVLQEGETAALSRCDGRMEKCQSCQLYKKNGGRCDGCTPQHFAKLGENFQACYTECNTCTGFKVSVPAVCCRSPLKESYFTAVTKGAADWNKPSYAYTKRPVLEFRNKAIFYVSSGGVNTITAGGKELVKPGTELVAVNITRVWGSNGFYSRDLKDYLHLPRGTRLMLTTMCLDDMLERAWNKEMYNDVEDLQRVGFDYWMPLSFSGYPNEAHMHKYYQTLRTLYVTERMKAWWTTGDHHLPGVETDDLILQAAASVPQLVFNAQFAGGDSLKFHLLLVRHYHSIVPAHVPFWFIGASNATFVHNTRKQAGTRPLYFLSPKPLYLGSKGQEQLIDGSATKSAMPKLELVQQNYEQFSNMIRQYG